jgi:hypothetical protein
MHVHRVVAAPYRAFELRRAAYRIVARASMLSLMLIVVISCETTTQPMTFDRQLASRLTVTPQRVAIGDLVNAHWDIRNISNDTLFRLFAPGINAGGFGLALAATPDSSVIAYQSGGFILAYDNRLTLAPYAGYSIDAVFKAVAVGTATVDACMPPFVGEGTEWTCVRKTVMVVQHL